MGSMPEGRKCITCTGLPINESKRANLGKSSRILRRLLADIELKRIMRLELLSKANQLRPEVVYVNDNPLCEEELVRLQSCLNPPKKLKPGHYWYDNASGYWGKNGEKPCQIITPGLKIGGRLKENASNGNTMVSINNRVITKLELKMLKFAGVECEGNPQFWMKSDGSIKEEGMQNERGRLWDKKSGMKLFCAVLSLPTPPDVVTTGEEEGVNLPSRDLLNHPAEKYIHKLLLVGSSKSGTSTIFKQAKLLYNVSINGDERESIKLIIQSNLYKYLGILLEGRQRLEEETSMSLIKRTDVDQPDSSGNVDENDEKAVYSLGPRLKVFSDWFLQAKMAGNLESIFLAATREYAPTVADLWKSAAIQATYVRIDELKLLPRVASYFLNRAMEILRTEYEPSDTDIIFAEGFPMYNGPASVEFSFPKSTYDGCAAYEHAYDPSLRYELIRVHPRNLGGNYKCLNMFEDVDIVLFCVNLTDYDQFSDDGINKMLETRNLFERMVTHPIFRKKDFLLFLSKFDLFEKKINQVPLNGCDWFKEFSPLISHHPNSDKNTTSTNPSMAQRAFHYIAAEFKKLYKSLTGLESDCKLFVTSVTALEPDSVDKAFRYSREVLKWNEEKENFLASYMTSDSIDASSSQFTTTQ